MHQYVKISLHNCHLCFSIFIFAVGFWAEVTENHASLVVHRPILWSKVAYNNGNDYNPSTGLFRCRLGGMYWIGLSIFAKDGESMNAQIFKNGSPVVDSYAENNGQSTTWIIMELNPGDELHVENKEAADRIYARGKWSFFSGFRIA